MLLAPGAFLLRLMMRRLHVQLGILELLVYGFVIWNYVFVAVAYVIGVTTAFIRTFFLAFLLISLVITVLGIHSVTKARKSVQLKLGWSKAMLLALTFTVVVILILLVFMHSTYSEYDAIFMYLPLSKSIVRSGGLHFNLFMQDGLSTAISPVMPLIFAYVWYFSSSSAEFEVVVRILPMMFFVLIALLVFLYSTRLSQSTESALVSMVSFLCIPIVSAIAANYSLYLDLPFVFYLYAGVYSVFRLADNPNSRFWWLMFGSCLSLMTLSKDLGFLVIPSIVAIVFPPIFHSFLAKSGKTNRSLEIFLLSGLFVASYNLLFFINIVSQPASLWINIVIRQLPVFATMVAFAMLLGVKRFDAQVISRRMILVWMLLPLSLVVIFVARNLVEFDAISFSFPFLFNADSRKALSIITQISNNPSTLSATTLWSLFRWYVILIDPLLGAIFTIPIVVGLISVLKNYLQDKCKLGFFVLALLLTLLVCWSWVFETSFTGSELRRLLYFAPLLAVFVGEGVRLTVSALKLDFTLMRFSLFCSLSMAYFWFALLKINVTSIAGLQSSLYSMSIATFEILATFALFYVVSFFPIPNGLDISDIYLNKWFSMTVKTSLLLLIVSPIIFGVVPAALTGVYRTDNIRYIFPHWENDLAEVINYLNQRTTDNYTILGCYSMPISYFTDHPNIDVTSINGVMNLLRLQTMNDTNETSMISELIVKNIRYILVPKQGHSYFGYFNKLSGLFPILNVTLLSRSPSFLKIKDFSLFSLYYIVAPERVQQTYKYLTLFEDGWRLLNNYSALMKLNTTVLIYASAYHFEVITDDFQTSFWKATKANPTDEIFLSDDAEIKVNGRNSLKICVNGSGNISIWHNYKGIQDWSAFKTLTFYLFGANTSRDILITFHTKGWQDYYFTSIKDNFIGWKKISLPLDSFQASGKPSWSNITYIEILLGGRSAIYRIDQMRLEGYIVGLKGYVPSIVTNSSKVDVVISCKGFNLQSPARIKLISSYGELDTTLMDGVNLITIPSEFLKTNATLTIYFYQSNINEELELYYLGIMDK